MWNVFLVVLGLGTLCALSVLALKGLRRAYRHHQVAHELSAMDVRSVSPRRSLPDRRRSPLVRVAVSHVRPGEPGDPGAARILQFHEELARRGCYVDELSIARRLN